MKKKKYLLFFLLIFGVLKIYAQDFILFEQGKKRTVDAYFNYSLKLNEYEKVDVQSRTSSTCSRGLTYTLLKYDTVQVKHLLNSHLLLEHNIPYDSLEIELEILPERDTLIRIRKAKEIKKIGSERINNDWQNHKKTCREFRKSKYWNWSENLIIKDTLFVEEEAYVYEELVTLEPVKKNLLVFIPKETIKPKEIENAYTTVILYKVKSEVKKDIELKSRPNDQTTRGKPIMIVKGGSFILKETISNKEVKSKLKLIKTRLTALGYYSGKINKRINLELLKSLINYQRDNELSLGQFDTDTLNKLLNDE